jgi:nitrogen fixation protein NifU and related proteins
MCRGTLTFSFSAMHTAALLDHFRNPRNSGDLAAPAVVVEVENPACGDTLRLSALWENGRIAKAAYRTRGCTAAIAAGSVLTVLLTGRTAQETAAIGVADIEAALGGLPAESKHVAALCRDAVYALLRASEVK